MPSLFIPVAAMGKYKQINKSNSAYVSVSFINYSCDFVDAVFPTLNPHRG